MIDQRENEVLSWAIAIADDKTRAEAAKAAGNTAAFNQYNAAADASRQKLSSLGYPWVAQALSANGSTATQARLYVQALREHLYRYDPGSTPALSLSAALANPVSESSWGSNLSSAFTATVSGLTSGMGSISSGARTEANNWLPTVQTFIKVLLPVIAIWGFVKVFRIKANVGR